MSAEEPLTILEAWRHIISDGLRWGLGDPEVNEQVAVYSHGDLVTRPPCVGLHPGGLNNIFVTADGEDLTMCRKRATWTANLYVGLPYTKAAHDTLDLWVGRLDRAMDRCADDPRNDSGEVPDLGDVTAPFDLHLKESKVTLLVAAVEISISYEPQEK